MRTRIGAAVAVALIFSGAVAATYGVAFATDPGRRADARIFNRIGRGDQSAFRTDLRKLGHRIGGRKLNAVAAAGVALAALVLAVMSVRGRTRLGWPVVLLVVGGAFAITEIIKPPLGDWGRRLAPLRVATNAFPSGHATLAMAIILAAVMAIPTRRIIVLTACGAALATVLGMLIVVGGLHPPSDIVGGYFVAGAWAALLTPFVHRPRTEPAPDAAHARSRWKGFGLAVVALAGLAFAAGVVLYVEDIFGVHRTLVFLVVGLAAVSTLVVGVIAALTQLEARAELDATLRPRRGVRVA